MSKPNVPNIIDSHITSTIDSKGGQRATLTIQFEADGPGAFNMLHAFVGSLLNAGGAVHAPVQGNESAPPTSLSSASTAASNPTQGETAPPAERPRKPRREKAPATETEPTAPQPVQQPAPTTQPPSSGGLEGDDEVEEEEEEDDDGFGAPAQSAPPANDKLMAAAKSAKNLAEVMRALKDNGVPKEKLAAWINANMSSVPGLARLAAMPDAERANRIGSGISIVYV